jgi:hypothetical protein
MAIGPMAACVTTGEPRRRISLLQNPQFIGTKQNRSMRRHHDKRASRVIAPYLPPRILPQTRSTTVSDRSILLTHLPNTNPLPSARPPIRVRQWRTCVVCLDTSAVQLYRLPPIMPVPSEHNCRWTRSRCATRATEDQPMRCRACWTDKAYLRNEKGLKAAIYACLGLVPLKCHHCYHKFWTWCFLTWGQTLEPPKLRDPSQTNPAEESWQERRRAA